MVDTMECPYPYCSAEIPSSNGGDTGVDSDEPNPVNKHIRNKHLGRTVHYRRKKGDTVFD